MYKLKIILVKILLLAIVCPIAWGQQSAKRESKCTLARAQAPALRGLKLGMSQAEVLARFPGAKVKDFINYYKKQGVTQINIKFVDPSDKNKGKYAFTELDKSRFPEFDDVESLSIDFLDKRIYEIKLIYDDTIAWKDTDEFVARVSEALKLPKVWQKNFDLFDTQNLECVGFRMHAWIDRRPRHAAHLWLTDTLAEQRIKWRVANQRRTFKP
jgi:hypothetical protein